MVLQGILSHTYTLTPYTCRHMPHTHTSQTCTHHTYYTSTHIHTPHTYHIHTTHTLHKCTTYIHTAHISHKHTINTPVIPPGILFPQVFAKLAPSQLIFQVSAQQSARKNPDLKTILTHFKLSVPLK